MPHQMFNEYFLQSPTESISLSLKSAYAQEQITPIYFTGTDSNTDTANQLTNFKQTPDFPRFKKQYELLLSLLDNWCVKHNIQETLFDMQLIASSRQVPAFKLLMERLFNGYYNIREAILYREGKQALEELVILLRDKTITEELKKNVLSNLQRSIGVCSDGTLTNIMDAKDDLKESLGIHTLIVNIKRELIQHAALDFLRRIIKTYRIGNEIHYVNAFYNYVAHDYGVPARTDQFSHSLGLNVEQLQQFVTSLEGYVTPTFVVEQLIIKLTQEFSVIHQQFQSDFFADATPIPVDSNQATELWKQAEKLIDTWNNKYLTLLKLDLYSLVDLNEHNQIISVSFNKTAIKAKATSGFRATFLTQELQPQILTNTEKSIKLIYDMGQLWFEKETLYFDLENSRLFLEIDCVKDEFYWFCANELSKYSMQQSLIVEVFQSLDVSEHLECWVKKEYFNLITLSLRHDLLTAQSVHFLMKQPLNQFHVSFITLLHLLADKKLLISEYLSLTPTSGAYAGIHVICFLVDSVFQPEVAALFAKLINQNLITQEQLALTAISGPNAGINTIWWLACRLNQPGVLALFACLVENNLITQEQLALAPTLGPNAGTNAIWLLACWLNQPGVLALFTRLVENNLITQEQLALAPTLGPNAGTNAIWLLACRLNQSGVLALFSRLVEKNLITQEQLALVPTLGPNAGTNAIWLLAYWLNQPGVLALFMSMVEKNWVTREALTLAATLEPYAGINAIWWLAHRTNRPEVVALFASLVEKNLITQEQLTLTARAELFVGKNALWLLAYKIDQPGVAALFMSLVENNLIRREHLEWTLELDDNDADPSIMKLLGNNKHHPDVITLFQLLEKKKFISVEPCQVDKNKGAESTNQNNFFMKNEMKRKRGDDENDTEKLEDTKIVKR